MSTEPLQQTALPPEAPSSSVYTRVLSYLRPYRGYFIVALLCMVLFGATDGVVPFLIKSVLDDVFQGGKSQLLYLLPVALFIFAIVRAVLDFAQQFFMARIGHWIVRDIRNQVNSHLLGLSADFFLFRSSADLVSRVTSDVVLVRTLLTDAIAAVVRDSIRVVALLGAAIYLDPTLALIAAVVFPVGIYPVYRFGRRMRKLSRVGQEATGRLSALMQESVLGNKVVKIFGREAHERECFEQENEGLTQTFIKAERVKALTGPVNEVLASLAVCGVILYGGYSVMHNLRSQGEFIAFLVAVFLLYDPFKKLTRISSVVQQGVAGAERLIEVLDTQPTVREPHSPIKPSTKYDLEFEDVSFSYPPSPHGLEGESTPAVRNITLRIPENGKVALVGFSGAGKSTLVDLIPRFIDPQQGVVRLGGVDVSRLALADLRSRIAMVGQHTFLFHDTLFNNIAYGKPGATREEVIGAARAAYAYDFIQQLPKGFDTVLGEGGFSLSGGERQRVAIARAILKDAPVLILDEATASLDNRAEREVQAALEALERGRTTIVIAHRLSTVREADEIIVLKDGYIVERGSHDQLLQQGGEFAKLYALQFQERGDIESAVIN